MSQCNCAHASLLSWIATWLWLRQPVWPKDSFVLQPWSALQQQLLKAAVHAPRPRKQCVQLPMFTRKSDWPDCGLLLDSAKLIYVFFQWFLLRSLVWLQVSVSVASKFFLFLSRSYLWQHVSGPLWIDGSRKKSCLTDWIRLVFATSVFGWDGSMPWQITEIFQVAIQEMTAQLRRYFNWSLAV